MRSNLPSTRAQNSARGRGEEEDGGESSEGWALPLRRLSRLLLFHCLSLSGRKEAESVLLSRSFGPMPGGAAEGAGLLSSTLLCALCLGSAARTFQINRGAAAGFLLQALVPLVEMAVLLPAPLGLGWDARSPEDSWASTVVGLPLLAFGFHWLNGDCSTANVLLGGALLLAGGSGCFSEEGKALVAQSVTAVASITILIVSVFTGNACGILGGLLVGTAGLLAGSKLQQLLTVRKRDLLHYLMAAASLTLQRALRTQHQELDQGPVGLQVEASG
ncbi:hypothetical protein lerEdw1_014809 [Lerista edwardsae]|nr:hypothetical protein lerEdw1_014809 [Lerista edwardsae]